MQGGGEAFRHCNGCWLACCSRLRSESQGLSGKVHVVGCKQGQAEVHNLEDVGQFIVAWLCGALLRLGQ